jgi:hypothetical protein
MPAPGGMALESEQDLLLRRLNQQADLEMIVEGHQRWLRADIIYLVQLRQKVEVECVPRHSTSLPIPIVYHFRI